MLHSESLPATPQTGASVSATYLKYNEQDNCCQIPALLVRQEDAQHEMKRNEAEANVRCISKCCSKSCYC
jgi:hypothetical protein